MHPIWEERLYARSTPRQYAVAHKAQYDAGFADYSIGARLYQYI